MPGDNWAGHILSISEGFGAALSGIEALCELCCEASPSTATEQFRKRVRATTYALAQALEGASAMAEGLQSIPKEHCDPLQTSRTIFGLLLSQLSSYYDELQQATAGATKAFTFEKSQLLGHGDIARPPRSTEPEKKESDKKKKKADKDHHEQAVASASSISASVAPLPTQATEPEQQPKKKSKKEKEKEKEKAALEAAENQTEPADKPGAELDAEHLPYLKVRNTLADSLGVAVITTRPEVYLPFEKVVSEADVKADRCEQRYYLACPSLSMLVKTALSNSIHDEALAAKQQDATLDLLCDALVCEDINVIAFTNAGGEVALDGSVPLPSCAWRCVDGAAGGSDATLDTFLAFVNHQPSGLGECLILHDALVRSEHEREQVIHVIKPVTKKGILEVSVHHPPASLLGGAANAGVLASLYRRFFTNFFPECSYQRDDGKGVAAADTAQLRKAKADAAAIALNHQQKETAEAEAAAKAKNGAKGLIARTKDLTMAIATAPMAAVNAINDASQAAIFKNSFPDLDEEAIAAYNCAWAKGKIPKQGYLYATEGHLCFQSTILSAKFVLAYDEIERVSKEKNIYFDNSIEIEDFQGTKYFLTSFVSRDDAYEVIFKAWTQQ